MVDTRAGPWLLISTGLVTALVLVIQLWVAVANDLSLDFGDFMVGHEHADGRSSCRSSGSWWSPGVEPADGAGDVRPGALPDDRGGREVRRHAC